MLWCGGVVDCIYDIYVWKGIIVDIMWCIIFDVGSNGRFVYVVVNCGIELFRVYGCDLLL